MTRRICWDTMLFIYLFESPNPWKLRVSHLLYRSMDRGDALFASCLSMGEVLAGARLEEDPSAADRAASLVRRMGFTLLPFDQNAIPVFADLRSRAKVKAPDAIHLACAASAGVDLFLTADRELQKLRVPGIHFISSLENDLV